MTKSLPMDLRRSVWKFVQKNGRENQKSLPIFRIFFLKNVRICKWINNYTLPLTCSKINTT